MGGQGNKSESELFIEYAIRVTKNRIRLVALAAALVAMIAYTVGFLLVMVLADHVVSGGLENPARAIMRWLLILSTSAIIVAVVLVPLARRINDLYAARLIERAHPEFRNDLTAAIQLAAGGNVAPGPLEAIKRRAAAEISRADIDGSVATRRLRSGAIVLGVVILAFVMYAAISPKPVFPSLKRALGDDSVPAPTRTLIVSVEPESGTMVVAARPVEFHVEIKEPVGDAKLRISRDGGATFLPEDEFTMREVADEGLNRHFTATWPAAMASGTAAFEIRCGDAVSGPHQLIVLPVPTIRRIELEYDWPDYTGRANTRQSGGRIEAVASTQVTVAAEANLPVTWASVEFEKGRSIIMQTDGRIMTASITVTDNDRYRITYRCSQGGAGGESIWYDITASPDAAPAVHLTEPLRRIELPADRSLHLVGEAADDFGLGEVVFVCSRGSVKKVLPLHHFDAPGRQACTIKQSLPVSRLGRPGDLLTCRVEAKDYLPPDGQVGRSDEFELLITAPPEEPAVNAGSDNAKADEQNPQNSVSEGSEFVSDGSEGESDDNGSPGTADGNRQDDAGQNGDEVSQEDVEELVKMMEQDEKLLETIRRHVETDQPRDDSEKTEEGANDGGDSGDSENSDSSTSSEGDKGSESNSQGNQGGEGDKSGSRGSDGGEGGEGDTQGGHGDKGSGQGGGSSGGENGQDSQPGSEGAAGQGGESDEGAGQGGEGKGGESGGQSDSGKGGEGGKGAPGTSGATGPHDDVSGGDPDSGSRDKPGEVDDPGRTPHLTPEQVEKIRSTGRTINEADRQLRDDEVDEEMLKDLGMTREQYRNFVERYRQRLDKVRPAVDKTERPNKTAPGSRKVPGESGVQTGQPGDGEISVTGSEELTEEEKNKLNESRRSKVSPEYRRHVDEYYRSISDDEQDEEKPASQPDENAE